MPLHQSVPAEGLREIDSFAREHDLDLSLHLGFDGFAEYPIERGDHPVFAGFLPPRDGFWIAVTLHGQPFATYAGMPIDLVTNLTEHFVVDGLYPGDDRWSVVTDEGRVVCDAVTGKCLFGGGLLVDPGFRGTVHSRIAVDILPITGRVLGRTLYDSEHFIFLMKAGRKLVGRMDAEVICHDAIRWTRNGEDLGPRTLGYSSWGFSAQKLRALTANAPT